MKEPIPFILNSKQVKPSVDGDRMLLWVLRTDLGLTGTKYGCGESYCGSCTVLVDDEAIRSCQMPAKYVRNKHVTTIEGLAASSKLHPIQGAFVAHDALQCGYCTPGMIMSAYSLLRSNPQPSSQDIIDGMEGNLCRCGAHNRIVRAIETAAVNMKGGE